jgi:hypothetical protein
MTKIKNQDTQGDDYKITKLKVPVFSPFRGLGLGADISIINT